MSVCACCPLYCYWVPLRRVLLHHLYSLPSDICIYTSRPSLAGLKVSSLSLCDIPLSSLGSFYRLAPICPCFSCTGEPSINHSTSDVASWVGSKGHLPLLAGGICPNAAQEAAGCLYCEGSVLAHWSTWCPLHLPVLFCQAAFQLHPACPGAWGPSTLRAELCFSLFEFHECPVGWFLQPEIVFLFPITVL